MYEFNRNKKNPFEQKLANFKIFWAQKLNIQGPETDVMVQFLAPETDVMGERNYIMELMINFIILFTSAWETCFSAESLPSATLKRSILNFSRARSNMVLTNSVSEILKYSFLVSKLSSLCPAPQLQLDPCVQIEQDGEEVLAVPSQLHLVLLILQVQSNQMSE